MPWPELLRLHPTNKRIFGNSRALRGGHEKGMEFIFPFIVEKGKWPYPKDVMYWNEWPVRHQPLILRIKTEKKSYLETWEKLEPDPKTYEVLRNLPAPSLALGILFWGLSTMVPVSWLQFFFTLSRRILA